MKKLVVVLLVVLALLVVVDRVGDVAAQDLAASKLESSQALEEKPDVDITGFPFLTQLASGSFDRVDVAARDVRLGDSGLVLTRLDVELDDVAREGGTVTAARASGDGVLDYDDLGELFGGVDLAYAGDGSVTVSASIDLAGQTFTPSATATPALTDGTLTLTELALNDANAVTEAVAGALDELVGTGLPLDGVPFQVEVDDLKAERDGVHLLLSGEDLSYSS